jgi:hypothetical protein
VVAETWGLDDGRGGSDRLVGGGSHCRFLVVILFEGDEVLAWVVPLFL